MKFLITIISAMLLYSFSGYSQSISLSLLSRWDSGLGDDGEVANSETVVYDSSSRRVFSTNGDDKSFNIVDVSDIYNPTQLYRVSIAPYSGINCVAVHDGIVAVAVEGVNGFYDNGAVLFYDTAGTYINKVVVGVMPDMLTYSPNGNKLLVANEGEIGDSEWFLGDPEGSVSIINMTPGAANLTQNNVTTLNFQKFNWIYQTFPVGNDVDSFSSQWSYTAIPASYNSSSSFWGITDDGDGMVKKVRRGRGNSNGMEETDFWYVNNTAANNTDMHSITLASSSLGNRPKPANFSFIYFAKNITSQDSVGYILEFNNGTGWDMSNAVWLDTSTRWKKIDVAIPDTAQWIRVRMLAKLSSSNASAGFDDIKVRFCHDNFRIVIPGATIAQDAEPEYITITDDNKYAYVSLQENNSIAVIDIDNKKVVRLMPAGYTDHSLPGYEIDPSDDHNNVEIQNWPVKGIKMPDGIDNIVINGKRYILTANEGDEKLNEDRRWRDHKRFVVRPSYLYDITQDKDKLGRLRSAFYEGDYDYDGFYDELYCLGGRSFSIYDTAMNLIYDSGSEFEKRTFAYYNDTNSNHFVPDAFNSDNEDGAEADLKSRSDNKGPEPEAVKAYAIGDSVYAFIALERVGGIMVYNITDPANARFVTYNNSRDYVNETGDVGPEYITIIPASQNASGKDVVVVAHERSATLAFWGIDLNRPTVGFDTSMYTVNESVGKVTLQINKTGIYDSTVTVYIEDVDGNALDSIDYYLDENSAMTFVNGGSNTFNFDLPIINNNTYDGDRYVVLKLARANFAFYDNRITTVKIIDDEAKPIITLNSSATSENAGAINASFTKNIPSSHDLKFNVKATGGTAVVGEDYDTSSVDITFPANDITAKALPINLVNNQVYEKQESIFIEYTLISDSASFATNTDTLLINDDENKPTIDFSQGDVNVLENVGDVLIPLILSDTSSLNAEVTVVADNSSTAVVNQEYQLSNGTISYMPYTGGVKDLVVKIIDNNVINANKTVVLAITNPGADNNAGTKKVTINIIDDETTTSVNGLTLDKQIKLYPNPASTYVDIESTSPVTEVIIADVTGKMLKMDIEQLSANTSRIDVSKMPKGVYLIKVVYGDSALISKLILQ